jgi:hypothetical protein
MGWSPGETRIEELREAIGDDPEAAEALIRAELLEENRPRDRARLLGLLAAALREQRHWTEAAEAIVAGLKVPRKGAVAEAELRTQLAVLRLAEAAATGEGWLHALTTADVAVAAAEKLRSQAPGKTKWARRRQRYRASIRTSAYVTRSTVLVQGYGDVAAATTAALKALEAAEEATSRHMSPMVGKPYLRVSKAQLVACGALALCAARGGTRTDLESAVGLILGILEELPEHAHVPRCQITGSYACILARLGKHDSAEKLLLESLVTLDSIGATNAFGQLLTMLEWVAVDARRAAELRTELGERLAGR